MKILGKHVHILCIATPTIYDEAIQSLYHSFSSLGASRITTERAFKKPIEKPLSHDINIVMKAQREFHPDILPAHAINILFQSEQYAKLREFNSMPHSEPWDLVMDVFQDNVQRFSQDNVKFFPIGYNMGYHYNPVKDHIPDGKCDQDCYMFGARTKYRQQIWRDVIEPTTKSSVFGNDHHQHKKYDNILFSKVNLFIPAWEPYLIPTMHLMQILANKKFTLVVSDTEQDFTPYQNGLHFMVCKSRELKDHLKWYLEHEDFRHVFAKYSFEDIYKNHRFTEYLATILKDV